MFFFNGGEDMDWAVGGTGRKLQKTMNLQPIYKLHILQNSRRMVPSSYNKNKVNF